MVKLQQITSLDKVIRYVGVSPNEPYESNIGAKMGSWFMKYELSKVEKKDK